MAARGGKSSESVQCTITGTCLRMLHRPLAERTVPIRKICTRAYHTEKRQKPEPPQTKNYPDSACADKTLYAHHHHHFICS